MVKGNVYELRSDWDDVKDQLRQKYLILTEPDIRMGKGNYEDLLGRLEIILGRTKDELHKIISGFQN